MLAAISTTILSRRSCALTGSAITSRSRRNSTRGPPSAPRIAFSPVPAHDQAKWAPVRRKDHAPVNESARGRTQNRFPLLLAARDLGPAERSPDRPDVRERCPGPRIVHAVIANALCRGQDKAASPRIARCDAAAGCAESIGIDDLPINAANRFAGL